MKSKISKILAVALLSVVGVFAQQVPTRAQLVNPQGQAWTDSHISPVGERWGVIFNDDGTYLEITDHPAGNWHNPEMDEWRGTWALNGGRLILNGNDYGDVRISFHGNTLTFGFLGTQWHWELVITAVSINNGSNNIPTRAQLVNSQGEAWTNSHTASVGDRFGIIFNDDGTYLEIEDYPVGNWNTEDDWGGTWALNGDRLVFDGYHDNPDYIRISPDGNTLIFGWGTQWQWELVKTPVTINSGNNNNNSQIWDGSIDTEWYVPAAQAYSITNAKQLAGLAHLVNNGNDFSGKTVMLINDIYLNDVATSTSQNFNTAGKREWIPIGKGSNRPFRGEFDGASGSENRKIYGLYISDNIYSETNEYGVGLFGYTTSTIRNIDVLVGKIDAPSKDYVGSIAGRGAVFTNVNSDISVKGARYVGGLAGYIDGSGRITNSSYKGGSVTGGFEVGGLAGYMGSRTSITNSYSPANIVGDDNVGGLVGTLQGGRIEKSYSSGNVSGDEGQSSLGNDNIGGLIGYSMGADTVSQSWALGNVRATTRVGGLIGRADNVRITRSYSRGNVEAKNLGNVQGIYVGGLIGYSGGAVTVTESYSSSKVVAGAVNTQFVGGFVGATFGSFNADRSYFDLTASGQNKGIGFSELSVSATPIAKTTEEMKRQETYVGWTFGTTDNWGLPVDGWAMDAGVNDGYPYFPNIHAPATSIRDVNKSDARFGVRFFNGNIVSDKAIIGVSVPSGNVAEIQLAIYDIVGNLVFLATQKGDSLVWDLRNSAGRFVATGTYLVLVKATDYNGASFMYSAKIGVKK